jgi:4-hydroxybenzoate polyprenyltransferase
MVSSAVFITYHINTEFALMIIAYFSLNLLYSVYFKKINIIELMILSLFFVIRILAGCFAISVVPSEWLITVTFFVALFLVLTKRKSEILILENNAAEHRPVLKMYTLELLNTYTYIVATIILFSYILYTMDPLVIAILNTNKLIYSSIFVTIGLFRVIQISNNKEFDGEGDPTILILKDRYLQIILALWVLSVILFIYIK